MRVEWIWIALATAIALAVGSPAPAETLEFGGEIESRGGLSSSSQTLAADVGVTMRAAANPAQQEMSYEVTIFNQGKDVAQDVRLALALREPGPPGVRVKVSPSKKICRTFDVNPGNPVVTCTIPAIAAGQSLTINVVLANPGNSPQYSMAQVMSVTPDPNLGNNWATNIGHGVGASPNAWVANLEVSLIGTADLANQLQTYRLDVTNQGDDDAREIIFTHAFGTAITGTSIVSIQAQGATCSSRDVVPGLPIITCTVPQLGNHATAGATVVLRNPGNSPRISTAQVMSIVPDFDRSNNSVTVTVPAGGAMPPRATQPSATPPPVTTTPLTPSGTMGILKPAPLQIKPQTTAPAPTTQPSPAPYTGKYRVVINGLRANHETRDDMLQRDGKRDEVYAAAFVRLQSGPYTDPLSGRKSFQLHDHGFVKSIVHGDVNGIGNRVQAGTASDLGGIRTGDVVPGLQDPALPAGRSPSTTTFPLYVWEGTLDGGKILRIHPTLWEWDGQLGNYNHWTVMMTDAYINHTATSDYNSTDQILSQGNVMVIDVLLLCKQ